MEASFFGRAWWKWLLTDLNIISRYCSYFPAFVGNNFCLEKITYLPNILNFAVILSRSQARKYFIVSPHFSCLESNELISTLPCFFLIALAEGHKNKYHTPKFYLLYIKTRNAIASLRIVLNTKLKQVWVYLFLTSVTKLQIGWSP